MRKRILLLSLAMTLLLLTVSSIFLSQSQLPEYMGILSILNKQPSQLTLKQKRVIAQSILSSSQEFGVDPTLILAVMEIESSFRVDARSSVGALGLLQITPIMVREVSQQWGVSLPTDAAFLKDIRNNIRLGTYYLSFLLKEYHGNLYKSLVAYNMGPTGMERYVKSRGYKHRYHAKIMKSWSKFI